MDSPPDDFSGLFDFLPIGAFRTRPDGVMLRANPALVAMNGFSSEAQMLQAVTDVAQRWYVQPGRRAELQALLAAQGRVIGFVSEVRRYNTAERIWVSENAQTVCDEQGRVLLYEGTVEDITERLQARAALERSEQELRAITAQVPGVVYRVLLQPDGQRQLAFISEGVRRLFGAEPEHALQDNRLLQRFHHPEDAARVAEAIEHAIAAGAPLTVDFRAVLPDGTQRWVQQTSVAGAPAGDAQVRYGLMLDISDRKRAEEDLRLSGERWKLALEATGDGVWDWQVQEDVEVLSPQCKALYGFGPDELPDRPHALDSLTHPDDLPAMHAAREAHFAGHTASYVNEHRVRCKDGRWKWILSRGVVLSRDTQGRPVRMIGTHTDITERKQAEALRLERDLAAAADRAKTLFLSRVSHELRTPLNAILGFAQLLEMQSLAPWSSPGSPPGAAAAPGGGLAERELAWVRQILSSGRHLLGLMDDILDLSSAQTGKLPLNIQPLDLRPVVEEAWAMLAASAQTTGVQRVDTLAVDLALAAPLTLQADRKRLLQIISNLLSNAIKYNRPGGWVRLSVQPSAQVPGSLELRVADSGPGLSTAQRERLFQAFERLGAERGPVAGTGLGLALSHQLAQAMGGSLAAESEPGAGACFVLRLPLA